MWRPTASIEAIKYRAQCNRLIRQYFDAREVLEVETPIMSQYATTDPAIESFACPQSQILFESATRYLQTSPEFSMKRLLAAGSGSIYQLCKVFRQEEQGRWHNPEFTMLEWYRPGMDYHELMVETGALLQLLLSSNNKQEIPFIKLSYAELFQEYLGLDPHRATHDSFNHIIRAKNIDLNFGLESLSIDACLQLVQTHLIEPAMPKQKIICVYDYPSSQASLAKLASQDEYLVAQRFECFFNGVELANGFQELTNAKEQQQRFEQDMAVRVKQKLTEKPYDQALIMAMQHKDGHQGLPECSGVAVGLDRVLALGFEMSGCQAPNDNLNSLSSVLAFNFERA